MPATGAGRAGAVEAAAAAEVVVEDAADEPQGSCGPGVARRAGGANHAASRFYRSPRNRRRTRMVGITSSSWCASRSGAPGSNQLAWGVAGNGVIGQCVRGTLGANREAGRACQA